MITSHITGFYGHLMSEGTVHGQPLSPNAMLGIHRIPSRVLDDAVTWGLSGLETSEILFRLVRATATKSGIENIGVFSLRELFAAKAMEQMKTKAKNVTK